MEDQNIIIFLDKVKKLLELGNKPKAIIEMNTLILELEHHMIKKQGKIILPLPVPTIEDISHDKQFALDTRKKVNNIIDFINKKYSN